MHITFFVGNGFDISCGIHSSYSDFYKWYCTQEKSEKTHINAFRGKIESDINAGKENWADFEEALGKYTENFTKDNVHEFIECFEDAHSKLMEYLETEMARFKFDFSGETVKSLRDGIMSFYAELSPRERNQFEGIFKSCRNESTTIDFVSYNYTDTLDRILSVAAKEPLDTWSNANGQRCTLTISKTITHAHGLLDHCPIFGVNDEKQIANKALLEVPDFSRLMIKPKCVKALGELWHDEIGARISNSTIICIYGMSMGITDSVWFEKIMDWLKESDNRQLVVFWYTKHPSNGRSIWQVLANTREARKRLIDYSDYSAQQAESIGERIHVIENTKHVLRLRLEEIDRR